MRKDPYLDTLHLFQYPSSLFTSKWNKAPDWQVTVTGPLLDLVKLIGKHHIVSLPVPLIREQLWSWESLFALGARSSHVGLCRAWSAGQGVLGRPSSQQTYVRHALQSGSVRNKVGILIFTCSTTGQGIGLCHLLTPKTPTLNNLSFNEHDLWVQIICTLVTLLWHISR